MHPLDESLLLTDSYLQHILHICQSSDALIGQVNVAQRLLFTIDSHMSGRPWMHSLGESTLLNDCYLQ